MINFNDTPAERKFKRRIRRRTGSGPAGPSAKAARRSFAMARLDRMLTPRG